MHPLWNGEKVNKFVQFLAVIFVGCALFAVYAISYQVLVKEERLTDLVNLFVVLPCLYLFLVFLKVALTGYAPKTWLPWR